MEETGIDFRSDVDTVDENEWNELLRDFHDANLYQTWAYEKKRNSKENISHFVLKNKEQVVSAAQVRIVSLPVVKIRIGYIRWGPVWHKSENEDINILVQSLGALIKEYVVKRKLVLRILPKLYDEDLKVFGPILKQEGFYWLRRSKRERTMIMDITRPLEEIRRSMDPKWRNCLNKAEKNGLKIVEGKETKLFDEFIGLYKDLLERKQFDAPNDIMEFRTAQEDLPDDMKMKILLCYENDKLSAGAVFSGIGDTALYLFGAINDLGKQNKSSYLLQWKMIEHLKDNDFRYYDLHGINPTLNRGTYHFKSGLSGKNGKEKRFLGSFEAYPDLISRIIVFFAELLRGLLKR
jgi:lipid II:glycine glycyltransferase (peptidoglycan interpeptide bridge formation enzyme)